MAKKDPLHPGNQLRSFIERWNNSYPIDRWWREKHKVAFGSKQHREQSMINMRLEFEEDLMFAEIIKRPSQSQSTYSYGAGNWLKKRSVKISKAAIDRDFDRIDIEKLPMLEEQIVDGKRQITM